jgi:TRAP transporter TAXI family solute receptor
MSQARPRLRDGPLQSAEVRIWGVGLLVFALAAVVAWRFLPPPLPNLVRLGTGPVGGDYARFAEALGKEVAEHGIELEPVPTAGSVENIRLLLNGEIDVGLVQSGNLSDAQAAQLMSIASVFYEPVLVVERADWDSDHIAGGRIAIGEPGSGVNALTRQLLEDQGVREGVPPGTRLVEIGGERAVQALRAGEVDSGVFVTSLEVPAVRTLFADPGLRVANFALAEAFTRHYRYLRRLVIPAGLIDLRSELPPNDVQVIATTASLVIGPNAHRALIPLFIESAREQLYQGDLLAGPGEFPSAHGVEAPLAEEARQYFERGPSFFYRWLPFRYASAATRLTIILIPLLTLLYPLFRSAGPTYRWVIEHRVYRWYRVLEGIEQKMDASGDPATLRKIHQEIERVGDEIRATHVPPRYGANLFALRMHLRLLVDRLKSLENRS